MWKESNSSTLISNTCQSVLNGCISVILNYRCTICLLALDCQQSVTVTQTNSIIVDRVVFNISNVYITQVELFYLFIFSLTDKFPLTIITKLLTNQQASIHCCSIIILTKREIHIKFIHCPINVLILCIKLIIINVTKKKTEAWKCKRYKKHLVSPVNVLLAEVVVIVMYE